MVGDLTHFYSFRSILSEIIFAPSVLGRERAQLFHVALEAVLVLAVQPISVVIVYLNAFESYRLRGGAEIFTGVLCRAVFRRAQRKGACVARPLLCLSLDLRRAERLEFKVARSTVARFGRKALRFCRSVAAELELRRTKIAA